MPGDTLDLSDIQLPQDDADKPNESDVTPKTPEEEAEAKKIADEQAAADQKAKEDADAAKPPVEEKKEEKPAEGEKPEDKKEEVKEGEDKKEEEKLTPFHEHPDWKKAQLEKEEMQKTIDDLKHQIEDIATKDKSAEETKEARKTADQRIQEDLDNGWEPKTQAEILMRGLKYMREELLDTVKEEKKEEVQQEVAREEEAKEIISIARSTYDELGIKDVEQRKEVGHYLANLQADGIIAPITKANMAVAIKWGVEQLKKEGKLTAPAASTDTPTEDKKEEKKEDDGVKPADDQKEKEAQQKKQDETNSKINQPSGDTGAGQQKQKKPYSEIAGKTIDQIEIKI